LWYLKKPKVLAEWLTLLLRIREIPGSNIGPEIGYPDVFVVFLSFYRKIPG
jgi:hypothetical protein